MKNVKHIIATVASCDLKKGKWQKNPHCCQLHFIQTPTAARNLCWTTVYTQPAKMRVTAISSFLPTLPYSHLRPDAGAQLNRGYMNQTVTWKCHKELAKLYIKDWHAGVYIKFSWCYNKGHKASSHLHLYVYHTYSSLQPNIESLSRQWLKCSKLACSAQGSCLNSEYKHTTWCKPLFEV